MVDVTKKKMHIILITIVGIKYNIVNNEIWDFNRWMRQRSHTV